MRKEEEKHYIIKVKKCPSPRGRVYTQYNILIII